VLVDTDDPDITDAADQVLTSPLRMLLAILTSGDPLRRYAALGEIGRVPGIWPGLQGSASGRHCPWRGRRALLGRTAFALL
jgi:hypothetical protein